MSLDGSRNMIDTNVSLTVSGTVINSIQTTGATATYTINSDSGNIIISDISTNTTIDMPTTRYLGVLYTIIKKHANSITINGNGVNINGSTTFTFSSAIYGTMTIVWDGSIWLAYMN